MTAAETTPGYRDLADFARRAIEFSLLAPAAVVVWADEIIAAEDAPPLWAIELSLAPTNANVVADLLREVPGTPHGPLPDYLFLALLRRLWCQGQLTICTVVGIGGQLHSENAIPHSASERCWEWSFAKVMEGYREGWPHNEMRTSIDETLGPYDRYECLLPAWA